MINVKELRIGNYLLKNKSYYKIANGIQLTDIDGESLLRFEPIPLTPEILAKAGFAKPALATVYLKNIGEFEIMSYSFTENKITYSQERYLGEDLGDSIILNKVVVYLHELQNIYYHLIDSEIEIELL